MVKPMMIVHETAGGMGKEASRLFEEVVEYAKSQNIGRNYRDTGQEWTWSANNFAATHSQKMSFTIAKFRAIAIKRGIDEAAKAAC